MKIVVKEYMSKASIVDAMVKMHMMGIHNFKAIEVTDFDACMSCDMEIKKYKVKGSRIMSEKDADTLPELWPPYEQNDGVLIEVKLKVEFTSDEKWVREEFEKYAKKHISLSDYPDDYTYIYESESAYADEDGADGICYRWVAGVKFRRKGRKVIVSRYDYSIPL